MRRVAALEAARPSRRTRAVMNVHSPRERTTRRGGRSQSERAGNWSGGKGSEGQGGGHREAAWPVYAAPSREHEGRILIRVVSILIRKQPGACGAGCRWRAGPGDTAACRAVSERRPERPTRRLAQQHGPGESMNVRQPMQGIWTSQRVRRGCWARNCVSPAARETVGDGAGFYECV